MTKSEIPSQFSLPSSTESEVHSQCLLVANQGNFCCQLKKSCVCCVRNECGSFEAINSDDSECTERIYVNCKKPEIPLDSCILKERQKSTVNSKRKRLNPICRILGCKRAKLDDSSCYSYTECAYEEEDEEDECTSNSANDDSEDEIENEVLRDSAADSGSRFYHQNHHHNCYKANQNYSKMPKPNYRNNISSCCQIPSAVCTWPYDISGENHWENGDTAPEHDSDDGELISNNKNYQYSDDEQNYYHECQNVKRCNSCSCQTDNLSGECLNVEENYDTDGFDISTFPPPSHDEIFTSTPYPSYRHSKFNPCSPCGDRKNFGFISLIPSNNCIDSDNIQSPLHQNRFFETSSLTEDDETECNRISTPQFICSESQTLSTAHKLHDCSANSASFETAGLVSVQEEKAGTYLAPQTDIPSFSDVFAATSNDNNPISCTSTIITQTSTKDSQTETVNTTICEETLTFDKETNCVSQHPELKNNNPEPCLIHNPPGESIHSHEHMHSECNSNNDNNIESSVSKQSIRQEAVTCCTFCKQLESNNAKPCLNCCLSTNRESNHSQEHKLSECNLNKNSNVDNSVRKPVCTISSPTICHDNNTDYTDYSNPRKVDLNIRASPGPNSFLGPSAGSDSTCGNLSVENQWTKDNVTSSVPNSSSSPQYFHEISNPCQAAKPQTGQEQKSFSKGPFKPCFPPGDITLKTSSSNMDGPISQFYSSEIEDTWRFDVNSLNKTREVTCNFKKETQLTTTCPNLRVPFCLEPTFTQGCSERPTETATDLVKHVFSCLFLDFLHLSIIVAALFLLLFLFGHFLLSCLWYHCAPFILFLLLLGIVLYFSDPDALQKKIRCPVECTNPCPFEVSSDNASKQCDQRLLQSEPQFIVPKYPAVCYQCPQPRQRVPAQ